MERPVTAALPDLNWQLYPACLAVFFGDECDQFVGMLLHQLVEVKEHTAAIEDRRRAPRGECSLRGCNGSRHFLARAQRNLRYWLTCCGGGGVLLANDSSNLMICCGCRHGLPVRVR